MLVQFLHYKHLLCLCQLFHYKRCSSFT